MGSWLTIHPKVKAAFAFVALAAVGAVATVANGSATFNEAAVAVLLAACTAATAYLKSA